MRMLFGSIVCWLFCASVAWSQCDCDDFCDSGCGCGCNDPGNVPPASGENIGDFDSLNVVLLSRMTLADMGGGPGVLGNDCWGWTDPVSGREFALFGKTDGTAFVEITDPINPVYLGSLPTAQGNTTWRDIKVYKNRAYIVADGSGNSNHGVQVFELNRLLKVTAPPETFTANARYTGLGRAHNLNINEESGFAYVVGSPSLNSAGGPIILDLKLGMTPVYAGVFSDDGYTHDLQVVTYHRRWRISPPGVAIPGVLKEYNREIAFCSNEDSLTILDVSDKFDIQLISSTPYQESRYSHQGWLSEDRKYFFMDDELDELTYGPFPTRTHVWNVVDLTNPIYLGFLNGTASTIDHNLYVKGDYIYQGNYTSGLRILRINDAQTLDIEPAGFFDTYPADDAITFNGAWSCYPYFPSGNIIVSDRQNGLFVVLFTPPN